ncbi:hypothetical protein NOM01_01190 [Sporolactobacillus sp. STSJ-5]|uniref:hypothetical protein n=1 Tax=Sporolactobacillus sp. STSJ-5 TaxID=2965076 RepID=UPI00210274B3|nr:hypothetical protein [Sporolactobacillus sp. STSJ-5]MCQ2008601.1 hypothetical protein [Sporolactobacillus sp. STSJ-5]
MELTEIWHANYGYFYHYLEDVPWIQRWRKENERKEKRANQELGLDWLEEDPLGLNEEMPVIAFEWSVGKKMRCLTLSSKNLVMT